MKKRLLLFVIPLFLFNEVWAQNPKQSSFLKSQITIPYYSVKVTGGFSQWRGGSIKDNFNKFKNKVISADDKFEGDYYEWHKSAGMEIKYHFHRKAGISLSLEMMSGKSYYDYETFSETDTPLMHTIHSNGDSEDLDVFVFPIYLTIIGNDLSSPVRFLYSSSAKKGVKGAKIWERTIKTV